MPHKATPKLKHFARQLLDHESASGKFTGASAAVTFRVCEKLRPALTKLMGLGGFHALFARALVLAREEVPWLAKLQTRPDGCLDDITEMEAKLDRETIELGEVALVTQLLGLLITFIGPALTLGLVHEVWPDAAFDDLSFGEEEKL